jgi:hypothetical protein
MAGGLSKVEASLRQVEGCAVGKTRPAKLLAWIEPTASGGFKAVIVQARSDPGVGSAPVAQEFLTFAEARDWVEGASITLAGEIRWMSSP